MITQLKTALSLHDRFKRCEFFVNERVFLEILRQRLQGDDGGLLLLDRSYSSPRYRFINRVLWKGMTFTCATNQRFLNFLS